MSRNIKFFTCLLLSISTVFIYSNSSHAENTKKIFLNEYASLDKNITNTLRFEKVSLISQCTDQKCFKRPTDSKIAADGSFFVVVDSSNPNEQGIFLNKFNFEGNNFSKTTVIPLIQKSSEAPLLNTDLSKNKNKVAVYREPIEEENTLVQIVDLFDNSVKELKSVSSTSIQIGSPSFQDPDGNSLLAYTLDTEAPKLISIDTKNDTIKELDTLLDQVQSLAVSPDFKNAVITYQGPLAQSVSIFNIEKRFLTTLNTDPAISFSVDDFLSRVNFDFSGKRAALSSLGGNHVIHIVDLQNSKLVTKILDTLTNGPTISTISPDGGTVVAAGSIFDISSGFNLYKANITKNDSITVSNTKSFTDGSIVLDIDITPDQSKILVLVLKDSKKKLKIIDALALNEISELDVSNDNAQSYLQIDSNGRYAISPNTNLEASVSIINDFNLGPIFKSITPDATLTNVNADFTINGFIDLSRFSPNISVCFQNTKTCATAVKVSSNGESITGITPVVQKPSTSDVFLIANSKFDSSIKTSKYDGVFQFVKEGTTVADTFPPEITILAPTDGSFSNTKRILVLGKVNGTGSSVESVTVNGKPAVLSFEGQLSSTIANFVSDLQVQSDGVFEINVQAKDKALNINEKNIKIAIDTVIPSLSTSIQSIGQNQFKINGIANGTGSNISSIIVNSSPIDFTRSQDVTFTVNVITFPVTITVLDSAGNKNTLELSNPTTDTSPPTINFSSPANGQVFTDNPNISALFTVNDDISVKEVTLNGSLLPISGNNQYSKNITLIPGKNLISVSTSDSSNNKSSTNITVTFIPSSVVQTSKPPQNISPKDVPNEKEVLTLPEEIENLNTALIKEFSELSSNTGKFIDLPSTASVEIANPPPIPEGAEAGIDIPNVLESEESDEIRKGFSFASSVKFKDNNPEELDTQEADNKNIAILVDNSGRTFVVGFALLKKINPELSSRKYTKYQTTEGEALELTTTLTIPADASEGDAKVSILNKNESLATIPLKIAPPREVKLKNRKKELAKPIIKEPIIARIDKTGTKLTLVIKGRNFVKKIVTIDGQLEKLIGRTNFFTNVTFVPPEGVTIQRLKFEGNNKIILTADIEENIEPGIKLFNLITPRGADIGAIVFPEEIKPGKLVTSSTPESLILESE